MKRSSARMMWFKQWSMFGRIHYRTWICQQIGLTQRSKKSTWPRTYSNNKYLMCGTINVCYCNGTPGWVNYPVVNTLSYITILEMQQRLINTFYTVLLLYCLVLISFFQLHLTNQHSVSHPIQYRLFLRLPSWVQWEWHSPPDCSWRQLLPPSSQRPWPAMQTHHFHSVSMDPHPISLWTTIGSENNVRLNRDIATNDGENTYATGSF